MLNFTQQEQVDALSAVIQNHEDEIIDIWSRVRALERRMREEDQKESYENSCGFSISDSRPVCICNGGNMPHRFGSAGCKDGELERRTEKKIQELERREEKRRLHYRRAVALESGEKAILAAFDYIDKTLGG